MEPTQFDKPEYYENRELSWLKFNFRILNEARDKSNLLMERLKFLSITASNLDEFFMIRVASLKDMVHAKYKKTDIAGLTAAQQLEKISEEVHRMNQSQYSILNRSLLPALKLQGLTLLLSHEEMNPTQLEFSDKYFDEVVYPALTPMAVDAARPFPLILNKTLNIAALLEAPEGEDTLFATIQVPSVLPRVVTLPSEEGITVILLEEIIERNIGKLFQNHKVLCASPYRIMRNADLTIDEEDAADLLKEIQKQLKKRQWGEVIRLEVNDSMDKDLLKRLKKELNIKDDDIYKMNGPIDLRFLMSISGMDGFEELHDPKYIPQPVPETQTDEDIFTQIKRGDILLHHPYQSFDPVIRFVREAASDPNVLAIKQTLYRVSGNSPIIRALADAAENGKQVTVLVELKARFDEENNINWAKMLEKAGCHVIYGLVGLKTHSKITLVVRREEDGICRYVHLGTGNYNDSTAKIYSDLGLFTCAPLIGADATALFNMISGYSEPDKWNKLAVAPYWLRDKFLELIHRETRHALEGKPARIIAKMNSLCDKGIIEALYEASAAGVTIDLIIRGICCLKVGIPGISENISVRSIVGTFLEHSRIFYFECNGAPEIYMGSADWMPRNLDKRVEVLFPVEDERWKAEVLHILELQLEDNTKAHVLQPDGSYEKIDKRGKTLIGAQKYFCEEAIRKAAGEAKNPSGFRTFTPATAPESPETRK
ncbi:MAG: RNA degradosome polyphosphate kinase [Lachnospiraceae bacterium]|nr:RNA degradosome polyphosphate kinase [Lachnospiraceae bacterium]